MTQDTKGLEDAQREWGLVEDLENLIGKQLNESVQRAVIALIQRYSRDQHDEFVETQEAASQKPKRAAKRAAGEGAAGEGEVVKETHSHPVKSEERVALFAQHVARLAWESDAVRIYRTMVWGSPSTTLSVHAARRLLGSPVVSFMSRHELQTLGVPLDGSHTSSVTGLPEGGVQVTIDWPGGKFAESMPARLAPFRAQLPRQQKVTFAAQGSFLHELAMHARFVQQVYGWSEPDAIAFLVAGVVPAIDPLRVETAATFDLKGQPTQLWATLRVMPNVVSQEEVADAYGKAQKRLGFKVKKPIEPRNLALLKFVADNPDLDWRKRLTKWNATKQGEWEYVFPSRMERDYEDTARRVYLLGLRRRRGDRVLKSRTMLKRRRITGSRATPG